MARILLVEDDIDVCTVFEQIQLDAEHEVDSSETFRGGSELIGSRDYDLVIADGRLKDGTGALIVTGDATILRHSAAVDFLRYRWLLKPVRPQTLVEAVAAALRDRAAPH
jgi:DNA-binding NtrC family response regulator